MTDNKYPIIDLNSEEDELMLSEESKISPHELMCRPPYISFIISPVHNRTQTNAILFERYLSQTTVGDHIKVPLCNGFSKLACEVSGLTTFKIIEFTKVPTGDKLVLKNRDDKIEIYFIKNIHGEYVFVSHDDQLFRVVERI